MPKPTKDEITQVKKQIDELIRYIDYIQATYHKCRTNDPSEKALARSFYDSSLPLRSLRTSLNNIQDLSSSETELNVTKANDYITELGCIIELFPMPKSEQKTNSQSTNFALFFKIPKTGEKHSVHNDSTSAQTSSSTSTTINSSSTGSKMSLSSSSSI